MPIAVSTVSATSRQTTDSGVALSAQGTGRLVISGSLQIRHRTPRRPPPSPPASPAERRLRQSAAVAIREARNRAGRARRAVRSPDATPSPARPPSHAQRHRQFAVAFEPGKTMTAFHAPASLRSEIPTPIGQQCAGTRLTRPLTLSPGGGFGSSSITFLPARRSRRKAEPFRADGSPPLRVEPPGLMVTWTGSSSRHGPFSLSAPNHFPKSGQTPRFSREAIYRNAAPPARTRAIRIYPPFTIERRVAAKSAGHLPWPSGVEMFIVCSRSAPLMGWPIIASSPDGLCMAFLFGSSADLGPQRLSSPVRGGGPC